MEKVRLGEIAELITKGTTPTSIGYKFEEKGISFVKIEAISTTGRFLENKFSYISEECNNNLKRSQLCENDILFSIAGAIGRVAIVEKEILPANTNQALAIIRISDKYNKKFLKYLFCSNYIKKQYSKKKQGVAQVNLSLKDIAEFEIPVIDLKSQNKVVNRLDKVQEIIDLKTKQIEELEEFVKSQFAEIFGDMSEYKLLTYKDCTNFIDYRGHTPKVTNVGQIRMVNAKSVGKGYFKYIDEYVTEETYDSWMHRGFGYSGDVLFVTEGHTFGNTCLIPNDLKKFALGQRVITIKGKEMINNVFLNGYMQTKLFIDRINVYKTGGTAQGIRSKDLLKIEVPVPPIKLQNKFAEIVEQIDKQKIKIESSLQETKKLQESLMNQYFG